MFREPNPLDPFDDIKRWYAALWPLERCAVQLAAAVVLLAVAVWVTR